MQQYNNNSEEKWKKNPKTGRTFLCAWYSATAWCSLWYFAKWTRHEANNQRLRTTTTTTKITLQFITVDSIWFWNHFFFFFVAQLHWTKQSGVNSSRHEKKTTYILFDLLFRMRNAFAVICFFVAYEISYKMEWYHVWFRGEIACPTRWAVLFFARCVCAIWNKKRVISRVIFCLFLISFFFFWYYCWWCCWLLVLHCSSMKNDYQSIFMYIWHHNETLLFPLYSMNIIIVHVMALISATFESHSIPMQHTNWWQRQLGTAFIAHICIMIYRRVVYLLQHCQLPIIFLKHWTSIINVSLRVFSHQANYINTHIRWCVQLLRLRVPT